MELKPAYLGRLQRLQQGDKMTKIISCILDQNLLPGPWERVPIWRWHSESKSYKLLNEWDDGRVSRKQFKRSSAETVCWVSRRREETLNKPGSEWSQVEKEARDVSRGFLPVSNPEKPRRKKVKHENTISHVKGWQNRVRQDWKAPLRWQWFGD